MIECFFIKSGFVFWVLIIAALVLYVYAGIYEWACKKYPQPFVEQKIKTAHLENWMKKKSIHNFKIIYFEMFNLPFVWWWRPCFRIWRITRNTWLTTRYQEYITYNKVHNK